MSERETGARPGAREEKPREDRTRDEKLRERAAAVAPKPDNGGFDVDRAIQQVERLYRMMTGHDAPEPASPYAPIPAERDPGEHVDEQMNRLLQLLDESGIAELQGRMWSPPAAVWETDSELVVCLDLPGVTQDQVEVVAEPHALRIGGFRPVPADRGTRLKHVEVPFGRFQRIVALPGMAKPGEPKARLRDGILEIRLAKAAREQAEQRTVPVEA
jgi:HSP20 family protein